MVSSHWHNLTASLLLLVSLASATASAQTATLPIWSHLNEFERFAVHEAPLARSGDADALLALYMLSSGDRRTMNDYRDAQLRINDWIEESQLSDDPRKISRNANKLFVTMFAEFFGRGLNEQSIPHNYREQQSQLSVIFDKGEFNCISSSLLYIVAARRLGLEVEGVILPSHAFLQLQLDGEIIELETTSMNGFGLEHDASFYDTSSNIWFSERELAPPSFEQYQQRRIVSPYQLGLFNMINQHTSDERMSFGDRMRLAELRSHFLPADEDARKARLSYYYQEFFELQKRQDFPTAARLSCPTVFSGMRATSASPWT